MYPVQYISTNSKKKCVKKLQQRIPLLAYYSYEKDLTILIPFSRKFALNTITYCLGFKRDEFILPKNMPFSAHKSITEILKLKRYLQTPYNITLAWLPK